jgi:hypothetical protein
MRSDELLSAVRSTGIATADVTYGTARLLRELTTMQQKLFENLLTTPREGNLLHQFIVSTVVGTSIYRIPHRSIMQGAERIELAVVGSKYQQLNKVQPRDASYLEGENGLPHSYTMRSDSIQLFPTPDAVYNLRFHCYLRPNNLVEYQNRGLIQLVDPDNRLLVVDDFPYDQSLTPPAVITSGSQLIDVVRPNGAHDVVLAGSTQTTSTPFGFKEFVLPVGTDMSMIAVGDYVRVAEQSEWPQLPQEMHNTLADAAAAAVWLKKGYTEKAKNLASSVQADLQRFRDGLQPRVKDAPKKIKARFGIIRGRSSMRRTFPR